MLYIVFAVLVALGVVALFVGAWWGAPIALVFALGMLAYTLIARRQDPSVGVIERGRRAEPTGVPRKSSSEAETSNERVGQT